MLSASPRATVAGRAGGDLVREGASERAAAPLLFPIFTLSGQHSCESERA